MPAIVAGIAMIGLAIAWLIRRARRDERDPEEVSTPLDETND